MSIQIQLRRGAAAAWTLANPILAQGEMGIEIDTLLAKLGNGVDDWVTLPYWTVSGSGHIIANDSGDLPPQPVLFIRGAYVSDDPGQTIVQFPEIVTTSERQAMVAGLFEGRVVFDTDLSRLLTWDGTAWSQS